MRMRPGVGLLVAAALAALLPAAPAAAADEAAGQRIGPFEVDRLAEGVRLLRPAEAGAGRTNSLVVERDDGLLVVDAQPSPAAAKELLEAIAALTPKPVRFVVLTHPHADAAGGAAAFPREALVIGAPGCREAMADPRYDFGAETRERGVAEWAEPERRPPSAIPIAGLRLEDPKRPVEIYPVPSVPAHSSGDLVVWIRGEGIVAVGDLIAPSRAPFAKNADLGNWIGVLNGILSEKPRIVAPLRGPAVDSREVRVARDAIAWTRGQVQQGFMDKVDAAILPDRILESPDLGRHFGEGASRQAVRGLIEKAVQEAREWRRSRGFE